MQSVLDDGFTFSADDMSNALLDSADAAATVATAFRRLLILEPAFNRWMSMMLETFYKMDAGLTSLATSVSVEVDGEWRLCDNRVIVWLVQILLKSIEINVINQEPCVSRWQENVSLWTTRNFNNTNYYLGVLSCTPRAYARAGTHITFEEEVSSTTSAPSTEPPKRARRSGSRMAIRSRS